MEELGLASAIFFTAAWYNIDQTREIFFDGIGHIALAIGILWTIGAFFRMNLVIPFLISISLSLALVAFGLGAAMYGFFGGLSFIFLYAFFYSIILIIPFDTPLGQKICAIGIIGAIIFGFFAAMVLNVRERRENDINQVSNRTTLERSTR